MVSDSLLESQKEEQQTKKENRRMLMASSMTSTREKTQPIPEFLQSKVLSFSCLTIAANSADRQSEKNQSELEEILQRNYQTIDNSQYNAARGS